MLDNLALWSGIAVVLVVLAYALPLGSIIADSGLLGPGGTAYPAVLTPDSLAGLQAVVADPVVRALEVVA